MKRPNATPEQLLQLEQALPDSPHYERSFMHRDTISCIKFSRPTNFLLSASIDGHVKFWKKKDKDLATASDPSSRSDKVSLQQKAQLAQESSRDLTFLGESIEFVKQYRSHVGSVDILALSNDHLIACSACTKEKSLKIYDVPNFDMISIHKFEHINPIRCVFAYQSVVDRKYVIGADQVSGTLEYLDTETYKYETETRDVGNDGSITKEVKSMDNFIKISESVITAMLFHAEDDTLVLFHLNGAINFFDTERRELSKVKVKNHPDWYNLQKEGTFAMSADQNEAGDKLAVYCADQTVRIFSYNTGKQLMKITEDIEAMTIQQEKHQVIGPMEFQQRITHEKKLHKEIEELRAENKYLSLNMCSEVKFFNLDGDILIYPTMLGVRTFSLKYRTILGTKPTGVADNMRLFQIACAFAPLRTAKKVTSLDTLCSESGGQTAAISDPLVFATSLRRNRFYIYSQRETSDKERDIFNEKPTAEEMLAAQKGEETKRIGDEATLHTSFGDISIKLFGNECPKTVENFTVHARDGYFNGMIFHRVIKNFMIQTGCPLGNGRGGESIWGGDFEDEFNASLKHDKPYTVSMANAGPNTNGSQFFITVVPTPYLDDKHTVFGRVIKGMNVVQDISQAKTINKIDKPYDEIRLVSVTVKLRKF